jgi:hypothetical protein
MKTPAFSLLCTLLTASHLAAANLVVTVDSDDSLRTAIRDLKPGTTIRIAPGVYRPGLHLSEIRGTHDQPIVIEAADPENRPLFTGGTQAWHLSRCAHITLRGLHCSGQSANGINADDGNPQNPNAEHITFENLLIEDVGPNGNFDGIKCSGLRHLTITRCTIRGWGGQAIDFVGCHDSEISHCLIEGKPGFSQTTGPQFKGGCSNITLRDSILRDAGQRPVQAGGSTGLDFFRPLDAKAEASNITIRNNLIIGGHCSAAFTGVDGCTFENNTLIHPERWIFRILQESTADRFARCRNVTVSNNLIVFEAGKIATTINIGANTQPETFRFEKNHWFALDQPARSQPTRPTNEKDPIIGTDPKLDPTTHVPAESKAGHRPIKR